MATYYLWSGAGGAGTGADWTNAVTTIAGMAAVATADGDIIKVHKAHNETTGGATFTADVRIICVDKDSSDALATMAATDGFIASTNLSIIGDTKIYAYGCTFSVPSSATRVLVFGGTDGCQAEAENCTFKVAASGTGSCRFLGPASTDRNTAVILRGGEIVFGSSGSYVDIAARWILEGVTISIEGGGNVPTTFMKATQTDPGGGTAVLEGCDLSALGSAELVGSSSNMAMTVKFSRCKLGTSYVALSATLTANNLAEAEVFIYDCAVGDTHGIIQYANAFGSCLSDTGIYFTAGAAAQSWKVVTTSHASFTTPFITPWIDAYHAGTSSITPYLEILRDGSATAYQDDEVWAEFSAKVTSGSVRSSFYKDRMTPLGTPANQAAGAGTGSWTGEAGTAWSGKCDSGSAFTPAEVGAIRARLCVGEPSITVYVDPQIRT